MTIRSCKRQNTLGFGLGARVGGGGEGRKGKNNLTNIQNMQDHVVASPFLFYFIFFSAGLFPYFSAR